MKFWKKDESEKKIKEPKVKSWARICTESFAWIGGSQVAASVYAHAAVAEMTKRGFSETIQAAVAGSGAMLIAGGGLYYGIRGLDKNIENMVVGMKGSRDHWDVAVDMIKTEVETV